MEQKLKAYEVGELGPGALVNSADTNGCRKLAGYYLYYTNNVPTKWKLPIAWCFYNGFALTAQCSRLAADYVHVYLTTC